MSHIQGQLYRKRTGLEPVEEAKSVPLMRTGQGSFTKDTHPKRKDGKIERLYKADSTGEYDKMVSHGAKFGETTGKPRTKEVTMVFKDDKTRKSFEKKMGIKESVELEEAKFNRKDEPFTLVALKGKKVLETMRDIDANEVGDAMKYMKQANKGATISVEAKGGKVMHTESVNLEEGVMDGQWTKAKAEGTGLNEYQTRRGTEEETEYEKVFRAAMKKFGISSPGELDSEEEKKKFYDYVDSQYTAKDEQVNEDDMSDEQKKKREEIVKSLKKSKDDFEKRYGERAMDVMYATATKQAMK